MRKYSRRLSALAEHNPLLADAAGRVIVYVRGGNVQEVIADREGIEVMIVDYDNEEEPNYCRRCRRSFQQAAVDPELFDRTVAGVESL